LTRTGRCAEIPRVLNTPEATPIASGAPPGARGLSSAAGEFTFEVHRSMRAVEHEWRAFESLAQGHPYQSFEWLSAWDACIRTQDMQPFVVLVREDGRLQMLWPLVLERRFGITRLVPMGAGVCDYHAPLVDAALAERLDAATLRRMLATIVAIAKADYLLLTQVAPFVGDVRNPLTLLASRPCGADAHGLKLGSDWTQFYTKRRSGPTRSRLRRKENSLASQGAIHVAEVTSAEGRAELAAEITSLKAVRLQRVAGPFNLFARADVRRFFDSLARDPNAGSVVFFRMTVDGDLTAAAIGLVWQRCFHMQVTVCAPGPRERFSPGQILLTRLLEWAIAHGCNRFDFTIGDEPYKEEWCDERWALRCLVWPRTIGGRVGAHIALAAIALERFVRQRPFLYACAVNARTAVLKVRRWRTAVRA
jgi:CelD/BcsL family acetyltransferase involved in cellulose biosynthesis